MIFAKERLRNVLNASQRRVNKNSSTWWYVLKTPWRYLCKTSWRRLEDVLRTFLKTSWRLFEDVIKISWRRLEDVLKTYGQDEYMGLDQYVLKSSSEDVRHKGNISVLIKTSWRRLQDDFWRRRRRTSLRRLHQDECLLGCD